MDPDVNRRQSKKRLKACGKALPTDHQAAILLLEPGKGALRLKAWDNLFDRSPPVLFRFPDALRDLRPDTPLPKLLSQRFRIIPFIRRNHFETFAGATSLARVHLDRIEQRYHLGTLIAIGWRDAVRQGHAVPLGEAVDEDPLAFPPVGDALAAPLPRGKKRHQRRHTPNESCRVLQQSPKCATASPPGSHRPAIAVTSDAWHSWTPTAARAGHHTSGSPSSRCTTKCSESAETAHAASPACVSAVLGERHPRTSAIPNHSPLQIVLPYCPPMFR